MADKQDNAAAPADDKGAAEQPQQPAQVRGKLLTAEETTDWGTNVNIVERDAKTEENVLRDELEEAVNGDDKAVAEEAKTGEAVAEDEQQVEEAEDEAEVEQQVSYLEDPGEFMPGDYAFDVTIYDSEGNKPKTVKVNSIEDWEKLLEEEPNLGSSVAVNKAFRAAQKMELNQERDYEKWAKAKEEYEEAVKQEQLAETRNTTIFNEVNYLIERGDLPKLTQEETNSLNWDDPAVVKAHPNIAPHKELLAYMRKENASRVKAGLTPLQSAIDAYNAMQLDSRRQADTEARKAAGEARKAAGARVASGTSTPLSTAQPKGIAIGRVGRGDIARLGQNWEV
jgi:hypothetical protein